MTVKGVSKQKNVVRAYKQAESDMYQMKLVFRCDYTVLCECMTVYR